MQLSLWASSTASPHPAPQATAPVALAAAPLAGSSRTAAPASFGQWLHSVEAQQAARRPTPSAVPAPALAAAPAAQPGKPLTMTPPRPMPAPARRAQNYDGKASACASAASASARADNDGGPLSASGTATDPSAPPGPAAPQAVPLPTASAGSAPLTAADAAADGPASSGMGLAGDDPLAALTADARALRRTAALNAASPDMNNTTAAAGLTDSALAQAINGSTSAVATDGADPLAASAAGAGAGARQPVLGAARPIAPGVLRTAGRAGAATAVGKANAESADGEAPVPLTAGSLVALAGASVDKTLAGAIGSALATALAPQADAQAGTATADAALVSAGLAERSRDTVADSLASAKLPDALAIAAPGAGPVATLAKAAALHEARIATAVTDPGFAPALGATLTLLARDGVEQARLNLHPAEMGPITVQIAVSGTAARVDFHADVAATRAALEAALPALASALQDAGLSLSGGGVFQPSVDAQTGQAAGGGQGDHQRPRRNPLHDTTAGANAALPRSPTRAPRGIVDLVA